MACLQIVLYVQVWVYVVSVKSGLHPIPQSQRPGIYRLFLLWNYVKVIDWLAFISLNQAKK
jgi:hypothetical protein